MEGTALMVYLRPVTKAYQLKVGSGCLVIGLILVLVSFFNLSLAKNAGRGCSDVKQWLDIPHSEIKSFHY